MRDTIGGLLGRGREIVVRHARDLGSELIAVARGATSARSYEGASTGRRLSEVHATGTDSNAEIMRDGPRLRWRSRKFERDSAWAAKIVREFASDVVGTGIRPRFVSDRDKTERLLEDLWGEWRYQVDSQSGGEAYGLQLQLTAALARDGGVMLRRRWRRPGDMDLTGHPLVVPLQIQPLEIDYLATIHDGQAGATPGGIVAGGIEFDALGRRTLYHLWSAHPGSLWQWGGFSQGFPIETAHAELLNNPGYRGLKVVTVPVSEILHIYGYTTSRPGTVQAAPILSGVIGRLWDFDGWVDATMLARRMSADTPCYVTGGDPLTAPDSVDSIQPAVATDRGCVLDSNGYAILHTQPGFVAHLPLGKTVEFPDQPQVPGHEEMVRVTLQEIAAGTGMSYEGLSGDLSRSNFLALRVGLLSRRRFCDEIRNQVVIPMLCRPVGKWFLEAVELGGKWHHGAKDQVRIEWVAPPIEDADELTRIKILGLKRRLGIEAWSDIVAAEGKDPERQAEKLAEDRVLWGDEILDLDPVRQTAAGQPASSAATQIAEQDGAGTADSGERPTEQTAPLPRPVARQRTQKTRGK